MAVFIYKFNLKQNIFFSKIEELENAKTNEILKVQLEMQDQIFSYLAQDIHDNIGQKLTLAKFLLNSNFENPSSTLITDSIRIIGGTLNDLRDLSRSLSSEGLIENGLVHAIEFEGLQLEKSGGIQFEFYSSENLNFNPKSALMIFRIIQEVLQNIMKHSEATRITFKIQRNEDKIIFDIKDDGRGFDVQESNRKTQGLKNIKCRTDLLGGKLEVRSFPERGTSINLEIPVNEKNAN